MYPDEPTGPFSLPSSALPVSAGMAAPAPMASQGASAGPFAPPAPAAMPPASLNITGPYGQPPQQPGPRPGAVNDRFKMLVPAIVAAFSPRVGSRGTAALLSGLMRGRDQKMAQQEQITETQRRRAFEAAEFRKNAVEEMLTSSTPDELQLKYSALAEMAEFHGVDLQSALAQAVGVVSHRQDESLTKTQSAKALEVVKHNDQTNPGQWSAPDESGTMRARDWWVARAGAAGLLPGKKPIPKLTQVTTAGPGGQKTVKGVTDEELAAGVPVYDEPTTDQEWVVRNGKVTPIAKGARQPGDRPYEPPSTAQPNYVTLISPTGEQRQVSQGAAANALMGQGWKMNDPVALRQQTGGSDAEAIDTMHEVKRIATDLRNSQGFSGAFGVVSSRMPTMFQSTADAEVLLNSLRSLLTLENTGKLKGVLSNADMELLRQASTTLAPQMGEPAARAELDRLIGVMDRALAVVGQPGAGGGGGRGAAGMVTVQTPAGPKVFPNQQSADAFRKAAGL